MVCFSLNSWRRESVKVGTHGGTSPGDQVPSYELPIFTRKSSCRDQNLVPACQTMFEFVGQVAGTCPTKVHMQGPA